VAFGNISSFLEIISDNHIWHIPMCVYYHAQSFRLEAFPDFYAGSGSCTPELYSVESRLV
jgi:hypothetical protein